MNWNLLVILILILLVALNGCNTVSPEDGSVTTTESFGAEIHVPECLTDDVPRPEGTSVVTPRKYPDFSPTTDIDRMSEWATEFDRSYHYNSLISVDEWEPLAINIHGQAENVRENGNNITVTVVTSIGFEYVRDSEPETPVSPGSEPLHGERIDEERRSVYIIGNNRVVRDPSTGSRTVVIRC